LGIALGPSVGIVPLIESAAGLANARMLAAAAGVVQLAFGSIDYCADLGISHTRLALLSARSELVLASRLAARAAPLDGVTTRIDDAALVEDDARHAQEIGFGGKLCIHPAQLGPARLGFAPTDAELAWAEAILASGEDGAVAVDGAMVDAPVRQRARALLARRSPG
jgi:citrate lyase subunit beta/citryl-CoA lyase